MKQIALILFLQILTSFTLTSCRSTYKLHKSYTNYIPYKGNEVLVFQSNKNQVDTIFLTGIIKQNGCGDPLSIFPDRCEEIIMTCTRTDPNYNRYLEEKKLIRISAYPNGKTKIDFEIILKGSWFYNQISESLDLKQFDSFPESNLEINNKTYTDVKIFEASTYAKQYDYRENYALRFYWSLSEGFLGLDKKSEKWRLIKKYTPIYPSTEGLD